MTSAPTSEDCLVSVVLPTFNRARTLPRAIRSVLSQSYRNIELIVVDDGSSDNTAEIMAAIDDPRVIYHPLPQNEGASGARNAGMRLARGEYIAFQDSDDEWLADKLAAQVAAARQASRPAVVFHIKVVYGRDEARIYGPGRVCCVPRLPPSAGPRDFLKITLESNPISPQTLLFSRSLLDEVGFFDKLLVSSEDWDFALRLVRHGEVIFLEEPMVMTYIQNDSISTLKHSGVRSQLRVLLKLRRQGGVDPSVLAVHFARIGMSVSRLGKPKLGERVLREAIRLDPGRPAAWARLAANRVSGLAGRRKA